MSFFFSPTKKKWSTALERREIWINYDRICNFDWTVNWAAILECLLCHHYMSIYILCHFCLNWFILCCLKLYQLSLSPYIWLLKAEPFFWRASKQHFLFSSFNSHLQELLCWASLHFEVSVGINVGLYFYSAPSFAMGFPLLLNCCAFQAFCGVRSICVREQCFLLILPTVVIFTDMCFFLILIYCSV